MSWENKPAAPLASGQAVASIRFTVGETSVTAFEFTPLVEVADRLAATAEAFTLLRRQIAKDLSLEGVEAVDVQRRAATGPRVPVLMEAIILADSTYMWRPSVGAADAQAQEAFRADLVQVTDRAQALILDWLLSAQA